MKKLRGNQKAYLIFVAIIGLLMIINAIFQTYFNTKFPLINTDNIYLILFLITLFLTERYRLYYINALLFILAISYYIFRIVISLLHIEWNFMWGANIIINVFVIILLFAFIQYPIRIIKVGKRFKKSI